MIEGKDRVFYLGAAVDQGSHDYPPTQDELAAAHQRILSCKSIGLSNLLKTDKELVTAQMANSIITTIPEGKSHQDFSLKQDKSMTETFDIELIKALQTIRKFIEVGKAELEKIPTNTKEQNDILIREAVERNKLLEELESKNND